MREILFRGRRLDNGEWIQGYYELNAYLLGTIEEEIFPTIKEFHGSTHRVDPETVGQYVGWTDCKGQKIFEGDIVQITLPIGGGRQIVQVSKVYFDNGCFCVNWGGDFRPRPRTSIDSFVPATIFEIIGNIHTSPELLE